MNYEKIKQMQTEVKQLSNNMNTQSDECKTNKFTTVYNCNDIEITGVEIKGTQIMYQGVLFNRASTLKSKKNPGIVFQCSKRRNVSCKCEIRYYINSDKYMIRNEHDHNGKATMVSVPKLQWTPITSYDDLFKIPVFSQNSVGNPFCRLVDVKLPSKLVLYAADWQIELLNNVEYWDRIFIDKEYTTCSDGFNELITVYVQNTEDGVVAPVFWSLMTGNDTSYYSKMWRAIRELCPTLLTVSMNVILSSSFKDTLHMKTAIFNTFLNPVVYRSVSDNDEYPKTLKLSLREVLKTLKSRVDLSHGLYSS
jgi:hypothetical protein